MMASFCFALFSFQLDKVDETIIFVIIRSGRNVIAEDFCRCRGSAWDQGSAKIRLGILVFLLFFLSFSECGLVRMEGGSQQALRALHHHGKKGFQEKKTDLGDVNTFIFPAFSPPLPTHLHWNSLCPQNNPCQAPKCLQR